MKLEIFLLHSPFVETYSPLTLIFNLYVGTANETTDAEIWKYNVTTWTQVNTDGFGDAENYVSWSMAVYNGNLYVGAFNWVGTIHI